MEENSQRISQNEQGSFYDHAWSQWDNMIKSSPAPRIRRDRILSWLSGVPARSVLDVGCGNAEFLMDIHRMRPEIKLAGADISPAVLDTNRAKTADMEFFALDLEEGPLSSKHDAVICMEVIEHCRDFQAALKNLAAMTDKWLFITVPCGPVFEIDRRVGHKKHFRAKEVIDALARENLNTVKVQEWGFPFFNLYKHVINWFPDAMSSAFLSVHSYRWPEKIIASLTYAAFKLSAPKWGYQLFLMAERRQ